MAALICLSFACVAPRTETTVAEVMTDDLSVPHAPPAMTLVKAGSFAMGDETGELWDGSRPVHEVSLSYDFLIGTYQVTFDEYKLIDAAGRPTTDVKLVEGYRLPTEAEWEYDASGGHAREPGARRFLFPGSDSIDEVAWYSGNSGDEWIFKG